MAAPDMPHPAGLLVRLRDGLRGWLTARIADPAFQSWAARFPPTRPLARTSAAQLYDIVAGFVYSQTLFACVELDLFRHLRAGPLTVAEMARRLDLAPDAMERLAQAAAAIGLLVRSGERYALGPLGAAMLGAPGVAEMVRHHRLFYADLADPVALLRGETDPRLRSFWSYVGGAKTHAMTADEAAPYSALMAASQAMVAEETLAAVPLHGIRHLADIGGGEGAFLEAAARRYPALRVTLFDLPAVADRAEARFRVAGCPTAPPSGPAVSSTTRSPRARTRSASSGCSTITTIRWSPGSWRRSTRPCRPGADSSSPSRCPAGGTPRARATPISASTPSP
jgi:demethylspheroidene O-methyltransferase